MNFVLLINQFTIVNLCILGVILLLKRPSSLQNRVLALLVIIPAVAILFNILLYNDLITKGYSIFLFLTFNLNMLWSPAFYLYVSLMTGEEFRLKPIHLIHIIPLLISLIVITPIMLLPHDEFIAFMCGAKVSMPWQFDLVNLQLAFQCIVYVTLSYVRLRKYNIQVKNLFSDIQKISVFWLQGLLTIAIILFAAIFPPIIYFKKLEYFLYFLPIGLNCIYIFLVVKTLSIPILFTPQIRDILNLGGEIEQRLKRDEAKEEPVKDADGQLSAVAKRVICIFEEYQPYLNPELNIKLLSEQMGIQVHPLSAALNQLIGQNFYDFVNSYRIKYAINLLESESGEKYKIDVIAMESGFRSRSVFYTAFKKEVGCTPSEYKKNRLSR